MDPERPNGASADSQGRREVRRQAGEAEPLEHEPPPPSFLFSLTSASINVHPQATSFAYSAYFAVGGIAPGNQPKLVGEPRNTRTTRKEEEKHLTGRKRLAYGLAFGGKGRSSDLNTYSGCGSSPEADRADMASRGRERTTG